MLCFRKVILYKPKDKHGCLVDFDTSAVGCFWGDSLWQLLHTDMLVILCIFWQCQGLERQMAWIIPRFSFSGHGKAARSQRPWGSVGHPVVSSCLFVFSKASHLIVHHRWDYVWFMRQRQWFVWFFFVSLLRWIQIGRWPSSRSLNTMITWSRGLRSICSA